MRTLCLSVSLGALLLIVSQGPGESSRIADANVASQSIAAQEGQAEERPRPRPRRPATAGIPRGVPACVDALIQLASRDPFPSYDGRPSQIVNNGLLWNHARSRCSIGDNTARRLKVFEVATAWRKGEADKVGSLLAELKREVSED